MGTITKISWTDHTFNPWVGCQKVSPGCLNCYAEDLSNRYGFTEWGPHGERVRTKPANWRKPVSWNKAAEKERVRRRVFCASLADVFDNKAPAGARDDLWALIRQTPWLDWQLLTKRPQNILRYLPDDWGTGWTNVWLGTTTEDQATYDQRWPVLYQVPAVCRFISYEPAIGHLRMSTQEDLPDWLIWGGESGPQARVMDPQWAYAITAECSCRGVPVFGKQWGTYRSNPIVFNNGQTEAEAKALDPEENGKGGALLGGKLWREFPVVDLRKEGVHAG